MDEKFAKWQGELHERMLAYVNRERALGKYGTVHELRTYDELQAFALGAASVFSKVIGRSITSDDLELLLPLYDYAGNGFLVLEGLNDSHLVEIENRPNGELAYGLTGCVVLGEEFRRKHNHNICCPGCSECIRRTPQKDLNIKIKN